MTHQPVLSLVAPCYNEEKNVAALADVVTSTLRQHHIPYEFILVDNGSHDRTKEIISALARKNPSIKLVHVPKNQGYGYGIIQGLRATTGDFVGYTDGDNQVPLDPVVTAYHQLLSGRVDFVKGKRLSREERPLRALASRVYNLLFRLLFFIPYDQINSKPKIMKRSVYESLHLSSKDWFIDSEILIKLKRHGYRIAEIPYYDKQRIHGKSTVRLRVIFEFLRNVIKYRFSRL